MNFKFLYKDSGSIKTINIHNQYSTNLAVCMPNETIYTPFLTPDISHHFLSGGFREAMRFPLLSCISNGFAVVYSGSYMYTRFLDFVNNMLSAFCLAVSPVLTI